MPLIEDQFEDTLLIARRDMPSVVVKAVQGGYKLPTVRTASHHPADVGPTRSAIRDQMGLEVVILACRQVDVARGLVRRLLELELLDGLADTSALSWMHEGDLTHLVFVDPSHAPMLDDWFRKTARPPGTPNGRGWTVPGWWTHATSWIAQKVDAAGLGRTRAIEQVRAWEFSCVLRIQTDQDTLYFKALPRSYASEPALVDHLAQWEPAFVPAVVATNTHERWLLMRACRGRPLESGVPLTAWERVAGAYAELQVESSMHAAKLRALGCREHGPLELRTLVGALVGDEAALLRGTEHGLTVEETGRLRQLRPSLEAACDELAQSGLPRALEHGDLWSSNVYVGEDRVAFIDWTDASLSHPFLSLAPLLLSASWDPYLSTVPDAQQRIIDSYLEHWTWYAAPEPLRRALALARPLAAMHIAMTYWRDIRRPHSQWWMKRMVPFFLRMALAKWDLMS
jgi:hypothetical protein